MPHRVAMVCRDCGSENVAADAWAKWDTVAQDWSLGVAFDEGFCDDCDAPTKIISRNIAATKPALMDAINSAPVDVRGCPGFTVTRSRDATGGRVWILEHPDPMPMAASSVIGWSAGAEGKPLRESFTALRQAIAVAHKLREILDRLD